MFETDQWKQRTARELDTAWKHEAEHMAKLRPGLRVKPRSQNYPPFAPSRETACLYDYGPGKTVPYPDVLAIPENYGEWEITRIWATGWVSVRNIQTGQLVFSVPPTSVIPVE